MIDALGTAGQVLEMMARRTVLSGLVSRKLQPHVSQFAAAELRSAQIRKKGPDDRSLTAGRAQQWKITPIKDLTNQHYLLVTSNTIVTATDPTVLGENGGLNSPVVRIRRA